LGALTRLDLGEPPYAPLGLRHGLVGDRDDVARTNVLRERGGEQAREVVAGRELGEAGERDEREALAQVRTGGRGQTRSSWRSAPRV
jgi:hypothetical protein